MLTLKTVGEAVEVKQSCHARAADCLAFDKNGKMFLNPEAAIVELKSFTSCPRGVMYISPSFDSLSIVLNTKREIPKKPLKATSDFLPVDYLSLFKLPNITRIHNGIFNSQLRYLNEYHKGWWINAKNISVRSDGKATSNSNDTAEIQDKKSSGYVEVRVVKNSGRKSGYYQVKMGTGLASWIWLHIS